MVRINLEKLQHYVKTVNVVTWSFGQFVGQIRLEISRCYNESNSMNVSDINIHLIDKTLSLEKYKP